MTVVLRDVPGLTPRELIEAAQDVSDPDESIVTGYGGIVVSERLALRFLRAYLTATGAVTPRPPTVKRPTATAEQQEPVVEPKPAPEQAEHQQPPPETKRPPRAIRQTRRKAGEL
jgi:hypothetical protein